MKVKVTSEFIDKHTKKLHKVGEEMSISKTRLNEILKVGGFVKIIEQDNPETEKTDAE